MRQNISWKSTGDGLLQSQDNETGCDGLLQVQDYETGGDGLLHDHARTSRTGECHRSGNHDGTDDDTDHNLPNACNR